MTDINGIERIAAMVNIVRPDWPVNSLVTHLREKHPNRPYADLAVAALAVALDPKTQTPARLAENGPWWAAAQAAFGRQATAVLTRNDPRCEAPGHEHQLAHNCAACRADVLAGDTEGATP